MPTTKNFPRFLSIIASLAMIFSYIQPSTAQAQADDGLRRHMNAESVKQQSVSEALGRFVRLVDPAAVHYVKWDADGANNGTSWSDAYVDLQSALAAAVSGEEIWVAAGIYKPTSGTDRSVSFVLKTGVAVYGGFAGTESLRDQRDLVLNPTILSGDIGVVNDNSDNSYHVVVGSNTNNSAVLDNFVVTGGNANAYPHDKGGGIYNDRGSPTIMAVSIEKNYATFGGGMYNGDTQNGMTSQGSHPILVNVNFISNTAVEGGGMENQFSSSPSITNAWFYDNTAIRSGGGMLNMYNSSPALALVDFVKNDAAAGGGMANDQSSPTLTDVTFRENLASAYGGGMSNVNGSNPILRNLTFSGNTAVDAQDTYGGGMSNYLSSPALTNVTFHNNSATYGGGILNRDGSSNPILIHVTLSGNRAFVTAGGIANSGNVVIRNSILWGNEGGEVFNVNGTADVAYSIVQGGYPGAGNLDADPLLGPLQSNGRFVTQTMALLPGSPAIEAANNTYCPTTDQRGVARPQGASCDIGAYEFQPHVPVTLKVTKTADTSDGVCDIDCSLREAIAAALDNDKVEFDSSLSGQTITLISPLVVDKDVTIDGSMLPAHINIIGNDRVQVFQVNSDVTVTLDSLVIRNGYSSNYGGGIYNNGFLTVKNSDFIGNRVNSNSGSSYGGAIANQGGTLIVTHSTFSANTAPFQTEVTGQGGAIYSSGGELIITNSTFDNNSASAGGAIRCTGTSNVLTVESSTFSFNDAANGGAVYNNCTSTIESSSFLNNTAIDNGGAILTDNDTNPTEVTNTTFYSNSASDAGGIANYGGLIITNSTFSHNIVESDGVVRNGLGGVLSIRNSILANSIGGVDCIKSDGTPEIENIHNLIESTGTELESCGSSLLVADPQLEALHDNGGMTETMGLSEGSPAIDAGDDAHCPDTDQRGVSRPQSVHCDIGAYELEPTFEDVPYDYWSWSYIEGLYNAGVTSGCGSGNFCPTTTVTRDQMAVFLLRGKHGSSYSPPPASGVFGDVPTDYWAAAWIERLAAEGITSGCGSGNYCPTTPVTRDQMAVFLLRAKHGSVYSPPAASGVFGDVPTDHWAAPWIEQLAAEGITAGCGNGNYCPATPVTRDQMAVFLVRTFNLPLP